jgi:hypothetical protein
MGIGMGMGMGNGTDRDRDQDRDRAGFWPAPSLRSTRRRMIKTVQRFSGLLFLVLSGCAVFDRGSLDPRVASQVMVSKADPPAGCEFLGEVKGSAPLGELSEAHGDVLRNAVLRGGNYVAVDLVERPVLVGLGTYIVRGRLFACPQRSAAPLPVQASVMPAPGSATPRPCEPECAAGFTCQLGACIAAPAPQAAAPTN